MRGITIGLLIATGLALAIPANAQGVSVDTSTGGTSVGVRGDTHVGTSTRVGVGERERTHEHVTVGAGERRHCKVVIVHRGDTTKKIKRCD